jgi:group I intron endonuclease
MTTIKKGVIYLIEFPNGKKYVGKSIQNLNQIRKRYFEKESKICRRPVNNAIKKFGSENVKISILKEYENITDNFLGEKEKEFIKINNSLITENGYNIHEGGSGGDNLTNNPRKNEIIENIKLRLKTYHPRKGIKLSEETKNKISLKAKERLRNKENHPMFGKKMSELSKLKNSESNMGIHSGDKNPRWVDFLDREVLVSCIEKNLTYKEMYKFIGRGQKVIQKSLIYHFNTTSFETIKLSLRVSKEQIENDILIYSKRKLISTYKTNQKMFEKLLKYYFGTHSSIQIIKSLT